MDELPTLPSLLHDAGLDGTYWMPHFQQLELIPESLEDLQLDLYLALDEKVRNEDERKNLRQLLKLAKRRPNQVTKQEQVMNSSTKRAYDILQKLKIARTEGKTCNDEDIKPLLLEISIFLQISPESMTFGSESLNRHIECLSTHLRVYECVRQKGESLQKIVQEKFSLAYEAQEVLFTNRLETVSKKQSHIINMPEITIIEDPKFDIKRRTFTSKQEEQQYRRLVSIFGHGITEDPNNEICDHIIKKKGANTKKAANTKEIYLSTLKFSIIHLANCSYEMKDVDLSMSALHDLNKISKNNTTDAYEEFFKKYGSHVFVGPFSYGGHFLFHCSSTGFEESEKNILLGMQEEIVSAISNMTMAELNDSYNVHVKKIKRNYLGKCSENSLSNTKWEMEIIGGPHDVINHLQWERGLLSDFRSCSLIDQGTNLVAVWNIIKHKHHSIGNLDNLRLFWNITTIHSSDHVISYVNKWLTKEDLTIPEIQEGIKYFVSVKTDIMKVVFELINWTEHYLSQISVLKYFIKCIQHLQSKSSLEIQRIRDLMQFVIDQSDLDQLQKQELQEVNIISDWVNETSDFFLMADEVVEFSKFNNLLSEVVQLADKYISLDMPWSHKEISSIVSRAVNKLLANYRDTYDYMLIIILIHPFRNSFTDDNDTTLKPLSLTDLRNIRDAFSNEREVFEEESKGIVSIQAFLITLAAKSSVSNYQLTVSILTMMKKAQPPIDENILKYTNGFLKDACLSVLQQNFQYYMKIHKMSEECTLDQLEDLNPLKLMENKIAHSVIHSLNLCKFYPKKCTLQNAMCIKQEPLKLSLGGTKISQVDQLPALIVHKLLSYDYKCRSDLINELKDPDSSSLDEPIGIHPTDCFIALFLCSDNFLCQDLFSRLAKCQLAIPFILPDPITKTLTFPLWAMRSIVKEWNITKMGKIQHIKVI